MFFDLDTLIYGLPGLLAAIVLHELAHAVAAESLGDPTPRQHGRLTLNPLAHIDWIGLLMLAVFRFGWARPVPFNPWYFRNQRQGTLLVAAAGPLANLVIAFVSMVLLFTFSGAGVLRQVLEFAIIYNVFLAVFNILPVPPLDGSKILASLLPPGSAGWLYTLENFGWPLLFLLVATGIIGIVLVPMAESVLGLLGALARLVTFGI